MRATRSGEKPVQRISLSAIWVDCSVIRPDSTMLVFTKVGHSAVTLHAGAGQFGGQRLRQGQHARLADVVGGHARCRTERRGGGDVDDAAVVGLAQDRREHVAAVNRAPQVDAEHPVPVIDVGVADGRSACADARIVDHQGRRAAEPVLRGLGELDDVVESGDIAVRRQRLTACGHDAVGRDARGGLVDIAAHHPAAAAGEFGGERRADAAARAGDDGGGVAAALRDDPKMPMTFIPPLD